MIPTETPFTTPAPSPTDEALRLIDQIGGAAQEQGLRFTYGNWRVNRDMDDAVGGINSTANVI